MYNVPFSLYRNQLVMSTMYIAKHISAGEGERMKLPCFDSLRFVQSFYIFNQIIGNYDYNINTVKQQTMQETNIMLCQN